MVGRRNQAAGDVEVPGKQDRVLNWCLGHMRGTATRLDRLERGLTNLSIRLRPAPPKHPPPEGLVLDTVSQLCTEVSLPAAAFSEDEHGSAQCSVPLEPHEAHRQQEPLCVSALASLATDAFMYKIVDMSDHLHKDVERLSQRLMAVRDTTQADYYQLSERLDGLAQRLGVHRDQPSTPVVSLVVPELQTTGPVTTPAAGSCVHASSSFDFNPNAPEFVPSMVLHVLPHADSSATSTSEASCQAIVPLTGTQEPPVPLASPAVCTDATGDSPPDRVALAVESQPPPPPPVPADLDTMPVVSSETRVVDEIRGPEQDHVGQRSAPVPAPDLCAPLPARRQGQPNAVPSREPLGTPSPRGRGVSENAFPRSPDLQHVLAGLQVLFSSVEGTLQRLSQRVQQHTEAIADVRSRLPDPEALPVLADRVLALESQEDDSLHTSDLVMRQVLREYEDIRTRLQDAGTAPVMDVKIRSLEAAVGRHTDALDSFATELASLTNLMPTDPSAPLHALRDDIYVMTDSFGSQHAQLRADLATVYDGHHQLAIALQSSQQAHNRRSDNAPWVIGEYRLLFGINLLGTTSLLLSMLWRRDSWRPHLAAS